MAGEFDLPRQFYVPVACFEDGSRRAIEELREQQLRLLAPSELQSVAAEIVALFRHDFGAQVLSIENGAVGSSDRAIIDPGQRERLLKVVEALKPWRKGPFRIFDIKLDAEWRSDLKWERIAAHLDPLAGKRVADIGCNNGYYMFRLATQQPELIVGFDPTAKYFLQFAFLQSIFRTPRLYFELFGVERLNLIPEFFDVALCLGVIYHRPDPLGVLKSLKKSLKSGGQLIIESQVYPGDDSVAFCPPGRYGKAKNIYFVPSVSCLCGWLSRVGFTDVQLLSLDVTTVKEQRKTPLSGAESLLDFLDPDDLSETIEGYPAPKRAAISARKI